MSPFATLRRLKRGPVTPGLRAALGAGAALHVAGLALIGTTWTMPPPPPEPEAFVRAVRAGSELDEQAELRDPSPLFLPTPLNHGAALTRAATSEDAPPLGPISRTMPALDGAPLRRTPTYAPLTEAYAKRPPEEQLPRNAGDTFLTLGRRPPSIEALKPTGPRCVLRDEATGKIIGEAELPAGDYARYATSDERPAVFFVECDAYGVSPPILSETSGDAERDRKLGEAVAAALAKSPPPPGRMSVTAAP